MNIIFLTLSDINSIYDSNIYTDLLKEFKNHGHSIYIVSPCERKNKKTTYVIEEDICKILKVKVGNIQKTNIIEKGISTVLLETNYKTAIKKYLKYKRFDLILYSTPPITLASTIEYLKKRDNAKTYLLLKDIFPQNAVDLGMLNKNGLKRVLYDYFRFKEKKLYEISDSIGCMSQANVDFIVKHNHNISPEIIEVCPNSIAPLVIDKDEKKIKEIKDKYKIPSDKTVFIYGGNLGKPQGINFLIDCLKANKTNEQAYFIIAGSGTEYNKLKTFLDIEKPVNAQLFKQLPKKDYEVLVNSCDVGLIFLDKRFTIPNFPSRLLSYMQASMPVLAATDVNTDIGQIIEQGEFGYWCESSDVRQFNQKVLQLCNRDLRNQMGINAKRYLEENYTTKHSYEIIMDHFK
ncbi:glycosyltransferase WbuB [Psychrobacillus glaciei]|uniref:Glycosyltransferase WbuB n=1 Tax=Psychrobacillus glaciei TaxID=2283160 RepID=A0A5J6SJZ7_9BACI|nr:glycosyltransferase family 4 protein [Psychrobacillus glaciei]QFF98019.1 glycosyltransferase WbuB [Psychrobacillus glaciei]